MKNRRQVAGNSKGWTVRFCALDVGDLVTRYWAVVILFWVGLAIFLQWIAPNWNEIAADGDLAFLPKSVPSAVGRRAIENAFPGSQSRSQIVVVIANETTDLVEGDRAFARDFARRMHWMAAKSAWRKLASQDVSQSSANLVSPPMSTDSVRNSVLTDIVLNNMTDAIEIEASIAKFLDEQNSEKRFQRLPDAFEIRGRLYERLGQDEEATLDLETDKLIKEQGETLPAEFPEWAESFRDVWSSHTPMVGHKLGRDQPRARLISIQLDSEFTATENISIVKGIEAAIADLQSEHQGLLSTGLKAEVSGSAAVGADMLRAAASGVKKTEVVTIILVLLILATVYRAPFLVAIPLISIALSLVVASSIVSLLARDPADPSSFGLGVFTTTRIFIVVLLFGAGTDFCLFFLARSRELIQARVINSRKQLYTTVASGWRSVHSALIASACTTIVGLALMWFSRFEKFQFSGPIIAISLAVTLLVCLSFTPALLCGIGTVAFWPLLHKKKSEDLVQGNAPDITDAPVGATTRYWSCLADAVVNHPRAALGATVALLSIPAVYGLLCLGSVTYDLTDELSRSAPSRRGARLISAFFPINDGSPITVLLTRDRPFDDESELQVSCDKISPLLYIEGVNAVRSLTDPLGDFPPGKRMSMLDPDAWRKLMKRIARYRYLSPVQAFENRVAKFDVLLRDNPFSIEASDTLARLLQALNIETSKSASPWFNAQIAVSGTTVGVTDLRAVTQSDQSRIQILVTVGVWLVLVIMLRRVILSSYLIFTVLLSYFATLGSTYFVFATVYGGEYTGLDWKVPVFLFVILVAVGQDYNVYLVTRIIEESRLSDASAAVRRALIRTGGIITSCGFVMAGTFIAMTSPAVLHWLGNLLPAGWIDTDAPVLRGITELGFALAFGVLLDTLIVRSILVPSFVVLWPKFAVASTAESD